MFLALLALAAPAAISAQVQIPSAYRFIDNRMALDVQAGYHTGAQGSLGLGSKGGPLAGARWSINLSGPLGLEVAGWYHPTTRDVVDLQRPEGSQVIGEADMQLAAAVADLNLMFAGPRTWHGLSPFIGLGGGLIYDFAGQQPDDLLLDSSDKRFKFGTSMLARMNAGVKWIPHQSFEIRGDAGLDLWKLDTPTGWLALENDLGPLPQDEWVSGWNLTLGLGWRF